MKRNVTQIKTFRKKNLLCKNIMRNEIQTCLFDLKDTHTGCKHNLCFVYKKTTHGTFKPALLCNLKAQHLVLKCLLLQFFLNLHVAYFYNNLCSSELQLLHT